MEIDLLRSRTSLLVALLTSVKNSDYHLCILSSSFTSYSFNYVFSIFDLQGSHTSDSVRQERSSQTDFITFREVMTDQGNATLGIPWVLLLCTMST